MAKNKAKGEFGKLRKIIESGNSKIHFVGIGGISMYSLARLSLLSSNEISGSDREESVRTQTLQSLGVKVSIGHSESNVMDQDAVIYTHALSEDNPELVAARKRNLPVISRAEYLGALMTEYNTRIGVSGTHGKSTVVAMIDMILAFAAKEHTTLSGASLVTGEPFRIGKERELFLYEACEYKDSFLKFQPTVALALNLEYDHPDYFNDIKALKASFTKALSKSRTVIINNDDRNLSDIASKLKNVERIVTVGVRDNCTYSYRITCYKSCGFKFSIYKEKELVGRFEINVPGTYNVANAVFAAVSALELGIDVGVICNAIAAFKGIAGRMEHLGTFENKEIYADYAHHPTAVRASLNALKMYTKESITVVFKPHTYSRTAALFEEFANALSVADHVILTDVYAAREEDNGTVSSERLAALIGAKAIYCRDDQIKETVAGINHGAVVLMGAGGLEKIKKELC